MAQGTAGYRIGIADATDHRPVRLLALGSAVALVGTYLSVLYHVTDVAGGVEWLLAYVAGAFLLGTVASRVLSARAGIAVGTAILVAGLGAYVALMPEVYYSRLTPGRLYADLASLVTGQSVIVLLNADLWAVAIAPGPTFLAWYLALRRRYALAALAGGATLGFFVLTGDAGETVTTIGAAASLGLVGFGTIERDEGTWEQALDLGIVVALALFVARTVNVVPQGRGAYGGGSGAATLEGSLIGSPGQVAVRGSITLSPEPRFSVSADRPAYWRVTAHDRYTGQGWVRTGSDRPYRRELRGPPGVSAWLTQEFEAESEVRAMPAAWKPVSVGGDAADRAMVTEMGGLRPSEALSPGDSYTVDSLRPQWTPEELREAGTDYPEAVRERFLDLPDSTPERLHRHAREVTDGASSPYDAVVALKDWLEREKEYSLSTQAVRWDVADAFVFELDRGYCVHFATALAAMARSIGVPSRFVVGYTPGVPDGDRLLVRGLHSHAWVEVYFPGTGWVAVDPTPAEPREAAERRRLQEAEGGGSLAEALGRFEANRTSPTPVEVTRSNASATATLTTTAGNATNGSSAEDSPTGGETPSDGSSDDDGSGGFTLGRRDRLSLLFGLVGVALGAYRVGVLQRVYRAVWEHQQGPTGSPEEDVTRALDRLEYHLARRFRARRDDETPRGYLDAIESEFGADLDGRALGVVERYERVRYAGDDDPEEAATALRLADELIEAHRSSRS